MWKWTDGSPFDYEYWYKGENCVQPDLYSSIPDSLSGSLELSCALIWYDTYHFCNNGESQGTWSDFNCDALHLDGAICQKQKGKSISCLRAAKRKGLFYC